MAAIEGGAVANGDEDILKAMPLRTMIVDIAGGNSPQTCICRKARESGDAAGIAKDEIVLQFDRDILPTEPLDVTIKQVAGVTPMTLVDEAR